MEGLHRFSAGHPTPHIPEKDKQAVQQLKEAAKKHLPDPSDSDSPGCAHIEDMDIAASEGVPEVDLSHVLMHRTAALSARESIPDLDELMRLDELINRFDGAWNYPHDPDVRMGFETLQGRFPLRKGEQKGVLVLESSGGGGHIAVAKQVVSELEAEGGVSAGDHQSIYRKNVMDDFLGKRMTNAMVGPWNQAVREGNVEKQRSMLKKRHLGEMVVYLPIFMGTLFTLASMKTPPIKVITTQPLGLKAILKAVATYNKIMAFKHKSWTPVLVEQKLTDLLTPRAIHFVAPLKSLSPTERQQLILQIPGDEADFKDMVKDLLGDGFHKVKYTGNKGLPVNPLFLSEELEAYLPGEAVIIPLNSLTQEQENRIRRVPNLAPSLGETVKDDKELSTVDYHINGSDQLHQLMLGSMPSEPNVMNFVAASLYLAQCAERRGHKPPCHHIRLLCGRDVDNNPSLFKQTCDVLSEYDRDENIPEWLKICPLPFQAPVNIAKGGMRANQYFSRGGGATSMEHIAMSRMKANTKSLSGSDAGHICIVGEGTKQCENSEELLKHDFPLVWEAGNAEFLKDHCGAKVTNRFNFLENLAPSYLGDKSDGALTEDELQGFESFRSKFVNTWNRVKDSSKTH